MDIYGYLWIFTDIYGYFFDMFGHLCTFLDIYEVNGILQHPVIDIKVDYGVLWDKIISFISILYLLDYNGIILDNQGIQGISWEDKNGITWG